jgi:hypothetical protein
MSVQPKWSTSGANILAKEKVEAVRRHLEDVGSIAVLWWHYYGSRAPTPRAFDDFEEFMAFLKNEPRPGDAIDVWPFPSDAATRVAEGKIPNERGEVPEGGAY